MKRAQSSGSESGLHRHLETPIIYIIPSLSTGGAELQTINQVNFLHEQSVNVSLVVLSNQVEHIDRVNLPDDKILVFNKNDHETLGKQFLLKMLSMIRFLMKAVPKNELAHVILVLEEAHIAGRLLKLFRPKLIVHCYFRDIHYSPNRSIGVKLFNRLNNLLSRKLDNSSIFISEAVRENIQKKFHTLNTLTVSNSLPEIKIDAEVGQTYLAEMNISHEYTILLPGRLHEKKGHLSFLQEFKDFLTRENLTSHQVGLIMAGEGPERIKIEQNIRENNLEEYTHCTGALPHELLLSLYKCCNLIVIPSLREGFGNVAIEGLLQQALMLVSAVDGLAEIIKNGVNGFTYDVFNKGEGALRLSFLYKQRDKQLINPQQLLDDFRSKYALQSQMMILKEHLLRTETNLNYHKSVDSR